MASSRVVTFTTDFGLQDAFVGIMHGVVLNIAPETRVVDISHAIQSYDVNDGAWTIAQAYRFFPPRTVHVVIVDPGVGSARRPILAETDRYIFIAPDNGVLSMVEASEPRFAVRHITAERYFLQPVSRTFHGRDIFAPVAGRISQGIAAAEFGPEIEDYVRLPLPVVERIGDNTLRGAVTRVDKFGNLITNIGKLEVLEMFGPGDTPRPAGTAPKSKAVNILVAGRTLTRLCDSYAEGADDEFFGIIGSSGYLEIAARQSSAAEKLAAGVGTPVGIVFSAEHSS